MIQQVIIQLRENSLPKWKVALIEGANVEELRKKSLQKLLNGKMLCLSLHRKYMDVLNKHDILQHYQRFYNKAVQEDKKFICTTGQQTISIHELAEIIYQIEDDELLFPSSSLLPPLTSGQLSFEEENSSNSTPYTDTQAGFHVKYESADECVNL